MTAVGTKTLVALRKVLLLFVFLLTNIQSGESKKSTSEDSQQCPGGDHVLYNGNCYYYRAERRTWQQAQLQCEDLGGTLLIAEEPNELKAILKDLKEKTRSNDLGTDTRFWIGLHGQHEGGSYYWADGTPLQSTWQGKIAKMDSSSERCVSVQGSGGDKIDVISCDTNTSFICEIRPNEARWSGWSPWSACSVTCESGSQTRTRKCLRPFQQASRTCQGEGSERKSCSLPRCQSVATWGAWREWEPCSVTCDVGTRTRQRACQGDQCSGAAEQSERCRQDSCPVWEAWQPWSACSVTCGAGGERSRSRQCSSNRKGACSGRAEETAPCDNSPQCPAWLEWGAWGECTETCGSRGQRSRTRQCSSTDKNACPGSDSEREPCRGLPECAGPTKDKGEKGKGKKPTGKEQHLADASKGYIIEGYEIKRTVVTTSSSCAMECMRTSDCRSFSYQTEEAEEEEGEKNTKEEKEKAQASDGGKSKTKPRKSIMRTVAVRIQGRVKTLDIEVDERLCILNSVSIDEAGNQFQKRKGYNVYNLLL